MKYTSEEIWNEISDQLKGLEPRVIGQIGVDQAKIWIGDPGYLNEERLNEIKEGCESRFRSWPFENGREGMGIGVKTPFGDGIFNVIGFFIPDDAEPPFVYPEDQPLFVMIDLR